MWKQILVQRCNGDVIRNGKHAQDLGANSFQVFWKVVFPLSMPGVVSGIMMVFMPTISTFAIAELLTMNNIKLFGTTIQENINNSMWNYGAALSLIMLFLIAATSLFSSDEKSDSADTDSENKDSSDSSTTSVLLDTSKELTGIHHAEIEVKDYGTIDVELDADTAPITVTNFVKLAQEGFYDGLTFHRIMDGFMIQGGDPNGDGTGGSEENIKGEFSNNGVDNDISHTRGTISMARASDPDSASSQFFIVQADSTFLDGDYAGFGHVTEGMDIVDKICEDAKPTDDNGTIPSDQQPVIEKITITD